VNFTPHSGRTGAEADLGEDHLLDIKAVAKVLLWEEKQWG
jgi:hypothetical protein